MTFATMKIAELRKVAEEFGVDLNQASGKVEILKCLEEEGVTYDNWKLVYGTPADAPVREPVKTVVVTSGGDTILVKMTRPNPHYETFGYTFTKEHPYVAMSASDAQRIFDVEKWGFEIATPSEVQNYYG